MIPHPSFTDLPVELTQEIYILARNIQLPNTNQFFRRILSTESSRLHLCTSIFSQEFTSKRDYTDCKFTADSQEDAELIDLQSLLLHQVWFTFPFAQRLQERTPTLEARALHRAEEDKRLRKDLKPCDWPVGGEYCERIVPSNLSMPDNLLRGTWTEEKSAMFHLLRSWYIDPKTREAEMALLGSAKRQAHSDGKQDIVDELGWYIRAVDYAVAHTVDASCFGHDETYYEEREQWEREMEEAANAPLPSEDEMYWAEYDHIAVSLFEVRERDCTVLSREGNIPWLVQRSHGGAGTPGQVAFWGTFGSTKHSTQVGTLTNQVTTDAVWENMDSVSYGGMSLDSFVFEVDAERRRWLLVQLLVRRYWRRLFSSELCYGCARRAVVSDAERWEIEHGHPVGIL